MTNQPLMQVAEFFDAINNAGEIGDVQVALAALDPEIEFSYAGEGWENHDGQYPDAYVGKAHKPGESGSFTLASTDRSLLTAARMLAMIVANKVYNH